MRTRTNENARFDLLTIPEPNSGCFLWLGVAVGHMGYGHFRRWDQRKAPAHRFAWERVHGAVPGGLCVLHRCDNPACVNVDHLFLGTALDNARDRDAKGRAGQNYNGTKTHCPQGHEYAPENTYQCAGGRRCSICMSAKNRRGYLRRRAVTPSATGISK